MLHFADNKNTNDNFETPCLIEQKAILSVGEGVIGTLKPAVGGWVPWHNSSGSNLTIHSNNFKMCVFVDSAVLLLGVYTKVIINNMAIDFCINLINVAWFIFMENSKKLKHTVRGMIKFWHIHKMELYRAIQKCFKNIK